MKRKIKYLLVFVVLLVCLFLFTDVYLLFLPPLDSGVNIDDDYGDVILVLGGGLKKGLTLGYSTEERLLLAVELFKRRKRPIIVSGGSLYKGSPAKKKIIVFLKRYGIDATYISFEGKSQTTVDHFYYGAELVIKGKFKEVIVSTSPYHQLRSQMILSYLKLDNFRVSKMRHSEIYQAGSIGQRLRNLKLITREYLAIIKFKLFKK